MTFRSVFLGLLGAVAICGVTFLNDRILRGTYLIGNNLPISVYGLLIIFAVFVNPWLRRLAFSGRETAVILALTLAACCIPSSGLLRTFPGVLILPKHYERTEAGWRGGPAAIREADIQDWPAFVRALRHPAQGPNPGFRAHLLSRLPQGLCARLDNVDTEQVDTDQLPDELRAAVAAALNELLPERSLRLAVGSDAGPVLSEHVRWLWSLDPDLLSETQVAVLNRGLLDAEFAGLLAPRVTGVVEAAPKQMLADTSRDEDIVLGGVIQGLGEVGRHTAIAEVPWHAWTRTLAFWLPIILCTWGLLVGLSLVVHRQWSMNEHLPYPISTFTDLLLPDETGSVSLFQERLFWIGAVFVLLIHLNNYTCQWFPDYLIPIQRRLNLTPIAYRFMPTLVRGGGAWLLSPTIYFIVIGIAFFIPTDVSLAFGLGPFFWAYLVGLLAGYGVSLDGTIEGSSWWMGLKPRAFVIFGATLGVFVCLLYTGRHHYLSLVRRSVGVYRDDRFESGEIWGCRLFFVLTAFLVVQLALGAGVGFVLAACYTLIMIVSFVVTSRVVAETGLFHLQIAVFPCVILWGLFGARAIGPRALLVLQIVSMVLLIDPRESLMPFMVNSLKVLELRRVKLGRSAALAALALVLGLGVGLPLTLYIQYDHGRTDDRWAEEMVPKMPFDNVVSVRNKLTGQGTLDVTAPQADDVRLGAAAPNALCVWSMLGGFVLVLLFTVARLRYTWWPLHPLMFALWATNHVKHFAGAFLLGWFVKMAVTKYGGSHLYGRLKPLMVGLIAGEVLGAVVPCIVGALYYFVTGDPPKAFLVLPG